MNSIYFSAQIWRINNLLEYFVESEARRANLDDLSKMLDGMLNPVYNVSKIWLEWRSRKCTHILLYLPLHWKCVLEVKIPFVQSKRFSSFRAKNYLYTQFLSLSHTHTYTRAFRNNIIIRYIPLNMS